MNLAGGCPVLYKYEVNAMRSLNHVEVESISGAMSIGDGIAAVGVVVAAGAVATVAPVAAGAALVGIIGISAIDIGESLFG